MKRISALPERSLEPVAAAQESPSPRARFDQIGSAASDRGEAIRQERPEERIGGTVEGRDEPGVRRNQTEGRGLSRRGGVERLGRTAGTTCAILLAAARNASGAAVQSDRIVL